MKVEVEVEDFIRKEVGSAKSSGRVYVPKDWIGEKVLVIREKEEQEADE